MNAMSSNTGYFILEWLVYISVILLVLACIVSLLNDIIPFKYFEIFSPRWYFWNLPAYLLYGVLVCWLVSVFLVILFGLIGIIWKSIQWIKAYCLNSNKVDSRTLAVMPKVQMNWNHTYFIRGEVKIL